MMKSGRTDQRTTAVAKRVVGGLEITTVQKGVLLLTFAASVSEKTETLSARKWLVDHPPVRWGLNE
jgi:hypothetical protein